MLFDILPAMTSPDLTDGNQPMSPESFGEVLGRWTALPPMTRLTEEQMERIEALSHPQDGPVKKFRDEEFEAVSALVKANRHFDAIRLVDADLARIAETFQGDDAISAREMAFRQIAYAQEHLATYGPYSQLPSTDPARRMMFKQAAVSYALSDLELGGKMTFL